MNTGNGITVGIDIRLIGKQRTGDEVVCFQLVRELVRRHDAGMRYVLYTDVTGDDALAALRVKLEALGREDVEIVSLAARNRFAWNAFVLPWRLHRFPVDVFHTQYILPLFLPRRLKVVTHIHDVSFRAHPEWIGRMDRFFLAWLMPKTFARSDLIVVPSEFTRAEIVGRYSIPSNRVSVVSNAAAEEWFQPTSHTAIDAVTTRYRLTPGRYFIASGTLQPRKNIPFLIKAFDLAVREHGLDFKLVLTGNHSGHNVDTGLTMEAENTRVMFIGYVPDAELRALVAGAAVYIFPSLYEGFGIPIEEALAQGTPVLASDIPVFHEVGGDRITYFDAKTLASFAENMYTFSIDHSRERLESKHFSGETRTYSWAKSASRLAQLYRSLANQPH